MEDHQYQKKEEEMIAAEKCCIDCRATKTPLWRSGPAGPKSLCNACGIRHRKKRAVASGGSEMAMKGGGKKHKYDELGVEWRQRLVAFSEGVAKYEKQRSESESEEKKKKRVVKKRMGDVERAALLLMSLSESKGSSSSPVFAS